MLQDSIFLYLHSLVSFQANALYATAIAGCASGKNLCTAGGEMFRR